MGRQQKGGGLPHAACMHLHVPHPSTACTVHRPVSTNGTTPCGQTPRLLTRQQLTIDEAPPMACMHLYDATGNEP
jgi:hypothetical protein